MSALYEFLSELTLAPNVIYVVTGEKGSNAGNVCLRENKYFLYVITWADIGNIQSYYPIQSISDLDRIY